jgi:hypothetical protein
MSERPTWEYLKDTEAQDYGGRWLGNWWLNVFQATQGR